MNTNALLSKTKFENVFLRIGQRGVPSSEREQMTTKQRVSEKLDESAKNAKTEPRDHHYSRHFQNLLALFAKDSS